MNQVKALSVRGEAHDIVDAVYSGYHYPHMRYKYKDWSLLQKKTRD